MIIWGKHYWFCNDVHLLVQLDIKVQALVRSFLGAYGELRAKLLADKQHLLLGIPVLADQKRQPYEYPKLGPELTATPAP